MSRSLQGRGFLQPGLIAGAASGITRPEQLAGRRVGVPQFWMTSSVWHRGIIAQQYNVPAERVTWCTAVEERFAGVTAPAGVTIERLEHGVSVEAALERGIVDAIAIPPRGVPRPLKPFMRWPYPDVTAAESAYEAETGIFPIMHFVVMRASLYARQPQLVDALTAAFAAAKPLGLDENERTLTEFLGFAREQGWISPALRLADCFVR